MVVGRSAFVGTVGRLGLHLRQAHLGKDARHAEHHKANDHVGRGEVGLAAAAEEEETTYNGTDNPAQTVERLGEVDAARRRCYAPAR